MGDLPLKADRADAEVDTAAAMPRASVMHMKTMTPRLASAVRVQVLAPNLHVGGVVLHAAGGQP